MSIASSHEGPQSACAPQLQPEWHLSMSAAAHVQLRPSRHSIRLRQCIDWHQHVASWLDIMSGLVIIARPTICLQKTRRACMVMSADMMTTFKGSLFCFTISDTHKFRNKSCTRAHSKCNAQSPRYNMDKDYAIALVYYRCLRNAYRPYAGLRLFKCSRIEAEDLRASGIPGDAKHTPDLLASTSLSL